jgi:hypothetical protein
MRFEGLMVFNIKTVSSRMWHHIVWYTIQCFEGVGKSIIIRNVAINFISIQIENLH